MSLEYVKVWVSKYQPELGSTKKPSTYYTLTESAQQKIWFATEDLHKLLIQATDYVLHHDVEVRSHFLIPPNL